MSSVGYLGNRDTLSYDRKCLGVPLKMSNAIFQVDLILLSIYGVDVMLSVQWIYQLRPVLFYYN